MFDSAILRQALADVARALCVLALVVFGLGSAPSGALQVGASPAVAAAIGAIASTELCGGGWGDDQAAHAPCHACRAAAAALPPPPGRAEPIYFTVVRVAYAPVPTEVAPPAALRPLGARAGGPDRRPLHSTNHPFKPGGTRCPFGTATR